jgi:predicted small lipoprotein YifL
MPDARHARIAFLACLTGLLAACGQKGPLYLPDETGPVVTRPMPSPDSQAPNTPETVDAPDGPANPAPEVTAPVAEEDRKKDGASAPR